MAYEVVMSYHLHMPSYFLGTFTEYPFHTKKGQSMRTYLCQKEPGIKLDNKEETIVKETNLYKALTILYPDIYN